MQSKEYQNFSIVRQTKGNIPNLPFFEIKNDILGKEYELSLFFPKQKLSQELHKKWKKKDSPVNVLSFPFDEKNGEIIITLEQARREAKNYDHSYSQHLVFLFIHACLHLKGMTHGAKMEKAERNYFQKYKEQYYETKRQRKKNKH